MACPGLHSMFSHFSLEATIGGSERRGIGWRTARTDPRVHWVVLAFQGSGWIGEVVALARMAPVGSPGMQILAGQVEPNEFAGVRALVVGGSRGLGAVTAKLIAAGGGKVIVTFATGMAEAQTLVDEIGPEACESMYLDVTRDLAIQSLSLASPVTHLYYFATPKIFRQSSEVFDRSVLDAFLAIYVDGFAALCRQLSRAGPLAVLAPSTTALDARPKGITEYVMAKAALEVLCADLARKTKGLTISTPRIPRVLTDQTAVVPPTPAADAVEVMLPLLRALRSAGKR
jgi:hypothetical protein